jgi:hypothetical protein
MLSVMGVGAEFVVDAATFAVSAVAVGLMSRQPPAREESGSIRRDLAFFSFGVSTAGLLTWSMLMYSLVPAEMLGRVSSVDWFVSIGLTPLSFALTGPIAEALGARATLAGAGVLGLLTVGFLFLPGVRDPERTPLPGGRLRTLGSEG